MKTASLPIKKLTDLHADIFNAEKSNLLKTQPYIIGIDIGTGSTKAVAVDFSLNILASQQCHYSASSPEPGYSEQDPELILKAFITVVKEVTCELKQVPAAISFSSAMHSLIPVDSNCTALASMVTWADTRAANIADRIRDSEEAESIYRTSGTPIHPMSPLCKLIWLKENNSELFVNAHRFISIKSFIWFKLFGVFEIDYSIACGDGFFDIDQLCWSDEICRFAGIDMAKLSKPVNTTFSRDKAEASITESLGISADTRFIIGGSDGCCANLGSDVSEPGIAALTIGSSGAVRITSPVPVYNYPAMTFNYLLDEKTFVCGGPVNNGGLAVDWLLKNFLQVGDLKPANYQGLFTEINAIPAGSEGLLFLPYLYGERAPIWDAKSSGAYLNIGAHHNKDHFLRASLEGVCYALHDVLQLVEKSSSVPISQINVSGGVVNSMVWLQILADLTGKKMVVVNSEDASAMGAIYLGMQSLGIKKPVATTSGHQTIINSNTDNHQVYQQYFPFFQKLYSNLKDNMHALYQLNTK